MQPRVGGEGSKSRHCVPLQTSMRHITKTTGPVLEKGKPLSRDAIHPKEKVLFRQLVQLQKYSCIQRDALEKSEDFYPKESDLSFLP